MPALIKMYDNFNKEMISAEFIHKSFVKTLNKELLCRGKMIFIPDKGIFWKQLLHTTNVSILPKMEKCLKR